MKRIRWRYLLILASSLLLNSTLAFAEAPQDSSTETGFMSRVQAVLQNSDADIDLAVLIDKENTFDFESGNRFQSLLDRRYSYNLVSDSVLSSDNAVVSGGVLAADGPAYKAVIVDKVRVISPAGIRRTDHRGAK